MLLRVLPGIAGLLLLSCSGPGTFQDAGDLGIADGAVGDVTTIRPDVGPAFEECQNPPLTAPASGTCRVTAGSAAVLLRGTVLAPSRALRNGHLLIEAGKVVCAACDCSKQPAFEGATVVECQRGVISAGLVNPHDHLGWATADPQQGEVRYSHRHEWRTGKNSMPPIKYPKSNYGTEWILWGETRMMMSGVTAMFGEGGIKGWVRNLDAGKDSDGLGKPGVVNTTFPLGDNSGFMLAQGCSYPSLPDPIKVKAHNAWVPHVAEGINQEARNEYLCLSGQQAGGVDVTEPNAAFIHAIGLTALEIADLARSGTGVNWSPRSNISLYGHTAQVVAMDRMGVLVSLGTDWVISGSMNMLRELACADLLNSKYYGSHFSDRKLFEMASVNAAIHAGMEDVIGQLREGVFADVAIWNGAQRPDYAAVVRAQPQDLVLVLKAGVPVYGDEALVKALAPSEGTGCEPIEVCQVQKQLCLQRETGKDLAALKLKVGEAVYPLFFCGPPQGEPTCIPSRPDEYDGKISATDSDGDGIPNDKDSCPKLFNPPRKLDGGKQPDSDADKVGDECDPCPLDANTSVCSTGPKPNDRDGDGIKDDLDNCPQMPNKGQEDTDGDKIGDVCDPCPKPNPGGSGCPFSIRELRDPSLGKRPPEGTLVKLENVIVVAVRTAKTGNYGFYVREGKNPFEAIFIFTRSVAPADASGQPIKIGDRVNLEGKLTVFGNIDEVEPTGPILVNGSGDVSPVLLKTAELRPASASGEGWESHLAQVSAVKVAVKLDPATSDSFWVSDDGNACTDAVPSCTKITDFFVDGGIVNGQPAAAVGQSFGSITGVVNGYKNEYSLDPRSAADLVP